MQEEVRRTSAEKERVQAEIYDAEIALAQKQAEVRPRPRACARESSSMGYSFGVCGQLERGIQEYHKAAAELKVVPSTGEAPLEAARCPACVRVRRGVFGVIWGRARLAVLRSQVRQGPLPRDPRRLPRKQVQRRHARHT